MNVAQAFIRALDNQGAAYLPYAFSGDWTETEREIIRAAIDPHVPNRVDAGFDNWRFRKAAADHFMARRATWEMVFSVNSAEELGGKVADYYAR